MGKYGSVKWEVWVGSNRYECRNTTYTQTAERAGCFSDWAIGEHPQRPGLVNDLRHRKAQRLHLPRSKRSLERLQHVLSLPWPKLGSTGRISPSTKRLARVMLRNILCSRRHTGSESPWRAGDFVPYSAMERLVEGPTCLYTISQCRERPLHSCY